MSETSKDEREIRIGYTNWRGEYSVRTVVPRRIWFGSTEWHSERQWLMDAIDVEKDAARDFALVDIVFHPPEIAAPADSFEAMTEDELIAGIDALRGSP